MPNKTSLITGATSGFGLAIAKTLAKQQHRLIICGRRMDRLEKLAEELSTLTKVHCLKFDVQIEKEVLEAVKSLPKDFSEIDLLVNNAGLALGKSTINEGLVKDWEVMIDTNVKGILYVTKALYPLINKNGDGHIINIGSIAGKEVYPGGNVYCASKHAVDALTKAMRQDFLKDSIRVSQIAPGAADTEFSLVRFKGDQGKAKSVYNGYTPLQAQDIADCLSFIVNTPKHVCINDLVVMPSQQANSTTFNTYE